jgi:hypothetical protein
MPTLLPGDQPHLVPALCRLRGHVHLQGAGGGPQHHLPPQPGAGEAHGRRPSHGRLRLLHPHWAVAAELQLRRPVPPAAGRVGKNPCFFLKNPAQGFFFFFCFFGFLGFLLFIYTFAQKRKFLGFFFNFKNTFRCLQALKYNHSY